MLYLTCLSLLLVPLQAETIKDPICYFRPPTDWELVHPKQYTEHVQIGFVGKTSGQFRPSINLAIEKVDVSLKEYVKAVKKIHTAEPGTKWRDLGKFPMQAGEGRLTEITSTSPFGEIKQLQALFVKDDMAYILTAAAPKEEMLKLTNDLLKSLGSLSLTPDLLDSVEGKKKEDLKAAFSALGAVTATEQAKQWEDLQKTVLGTCPEMGSHWHYLVLREGHEKIYSQKEAAEVHSPNP
jgi:hypothetical protein